MDLRFSVEELLMDESFLDYCLNRNEVHKAKWETIVARNPTKAGVIEEARGWALLLGPQLPAAEIDTEVSKMRELILSRMNTVINYEEDTLTDSPVYPEYPIQKRNSSWKKALAYGLVLAITGTAVYYGIKSRESKASVFQAGLNYESGIGERKEIRLADGSVVILNSTASLTLSKDYDSNDRTVQLKGSAFFSVSKDADRPFTVISPGFSTTAIGTSFYVHGQDNAENYSVELLEGKIRVSADANKDQTALALSG